MQNVYDISLSYVKNKTVAAHKCVIIFRVYCKKDLVLESSSMYIEYFIS